MKTIPNFRAQGLITNDHDLGAAMCQRQTRALPDLESPSSARERSVATDPQQRVPHPLRPGAEPAA
jgi:hypothetical protein